MTAGQASRILKIEQWLNEYKPKEDPEIPRGAEMRTNGKKEAQAKSKKWQCQQKLINQFYKKLIKQFLRVYRMMLTATKVALIYKLNKEFDPGSGRTLAARLTHASRTEFRELAL